MSNPSRPSGAPVPEEPAVDIFVDPVEVTPGLVLEVPVQVVNRLSGDAVFTLDVVGLEPDWVEGRVNIGPLAPGIRGQGILRLRIPTGHPPCQLVAGISAQASPVFFDQASPADAARPVTTDLLLIVGDGSLIGAVLEPPEVRGAHRGQFEVVLRNRGRTPLRVDLGARAVDPGVTVQFKSSSQVLGPGEEARVKSRVHGPRPMAGQPRRRPFTVRAQGRGTPVLMEGSFTQRPVLAGWLLKTVAIVGVLALWVTVAAVGISALSNHLNKAAISKSVSNAPPIAAPSIPHAGAALSKGRGAAPVTKPGGSTTTTSSTPGSSSGGSGSSGGSPATSSGGSGGSGSSGGSGGSGAGSGGSGSGGSKSGGSGAGSGGAGGSSAGAAASGGTGKHAEGTAPIQTVGTAGVAKGARVSGKLAGPQPGGVTVSIAPTSLVDENTQGANMTAPASGGTEVAKIVTTAPETPIGKVYGTVASASFNAGLAAATTPTQTTTTSPDGSWAFAGLRAPGDYLVTFSRAGYQTAKYIVTTTNNSTPVALAASLHAGNGTISGTVLGPSGPLGDADVTISDGKITAATKTPTLGNTGAWSVSGLSTPDTYLVTAKAPGFGAQITVVKLAAGATDKGISLTLVPGVGTITGTVTSSQSGAGVGGVKVTASSGKTTLSATTTTEAPVGSYTLPNLTIPGTYTLTVSGVGWVTQTQQVKLNGNPVVNAALTPSTGDVDGVASSSAGGGLAGAGVVLSNDKNTFKTLTESAAPAGGFNFGQVPPGKYVLSIEDFGYTTQSAQVTVVDGTTQTINLTLPFVGAVSQNTAIIEGSVSDFINAAPIIGATLTLDGGSSVVATTGNGGTYQIPKVSPGVHRVTATAKGYESASVQVSVSLGGIAFAPPLLLPIEDTVAGVVLSNAGGVVPNPTVVLVDPATNAVVGSTTSPPTTPTLVGIPAPALGGFQIDDVPHGNFEMKISAPPSNGCGTNAYVPIQTSVTVALGTNLILTGNQSPALDLAPSFNVITLEASASSLPVQVGGVKVTVTDTSTGTATTCTSPVPPTTVGAVPTDLTFPSLVNGDPYEADFSLSPTVTATPIKFTAAPNNSSIDTVVLAAAVSTSVPPVSVTLQYPFRSGVTPADCTSGTCQTPGGQIDCPLASNGTTSCPSIPTAQAMKVQMTGTVGYNYPHPGQPTSPVQNTFTAQPSPTSPGTWDFPDITGLLPSSVTFTVSDPSGNFEQFTKTDNTSDPSFANQSLLLSPTPTAAPAVTLAPTSGVTITTSPILSGLSLSETDKLANGTDVTWNDSASATPGSVEPGVYTLNFSDPGNPPLAAGFDPQQVKIIVPFHDPQVTIPDQGTGTLCEEMACQVTLVPHVSLEITPTPALTLIPGLPLPTVTLTDSGAAVTGNPSVTLNAANAEATFTNLSVADPNYLITIRAPGYQTLKTPVVLTQTPVNTMTPALTEEGWITGKVQGKINSTTAALPGVSMQATIVGPAPAGCVTTTSSVGVTDANGNYTLAGDPTTSDGGLCNGATYLVGPANAVPPTGYANATFTTGSVTPGDNAAAPLVLTAVAVSEEVIVTSSPTGDIGGPPVPNATVTALSGVGRSPVVGVTDATGTVTLQIDPTTYTFTVTADQYGTKTIGPVPFSTTTSTAPVLNVVLIPTVNVISGTVTAHQSAGPGEPLGSVTVSLYAAANPTQAVATAVTDASGAFSFMSEPLAQPNALANIPSGNYILGASIPGYSYFQQPQVFATAPPTATSGTTNTIENLQFQVGLIAVNVGVTSTLAESTILGSTVTLAPTTVPTPALTCATGTSPLLATGLGVQQQATLNSPTASFTNVVPDYYTVDVVGPGAVDQTPATVLVCPGGTTSTTYQVQEGQISGTVSAADGVDPSTATVDIYTGATAPPALPTGTPLTSPSISCSAGSCTYSTFVPLGSAYTVVTTLAGFTTQSGATPVLKSSAATASFSPALVPQTHALHVTVKSTATPTVPAPATATVTLALPSAPNKVLYTGTADHTTPGQFDFTGVAPNPGAAYNVTATFAGFTITGTVQVPIEPTAGNDPIKQTITADFGTISGAVTAAGGADPSGATVNIYSGTTVPPTGTPVATPAVTCNAGTCTYLAYVALGSAYVVQVSLPGYLTVNHATASLTGSSPTVTYSPSSLQPANHSVAITVASDGDVVAPSDAVVTLTGPNNYTGTPDANTPGLFDFTGVAPVGKYSVVAKFDDVTITGTVDVPVGTTATDPITKTITGAFGKVNGTVAVSSGSPSVLVQFCTDTACGTGTEAAPSQTITATAAGTPFSTYLPATKGASTSDFLVFSASKYDRPAPVSISVTDGGTTTAAPATLNLTPPPTTTTTTTTTTTSPTTTTTTTPP